MNVKTLILILLLAMAGFLFYDYATSQFSPDAMAYKRFANAVLEGDVARVRNMAANESVMDAMNAITQRNDLINGKPRFVYYTFLRKIPSEDGNRVDFTVRQSIRVDPPGSDSFLGSEVRRDQHVVTLERDGPAWKVAHFEDMPTRNFRMEREHRQR